MSKTHQCRQTSATKNNDNDADWALKSVFPIDNCSAINWSMAINHCKIMPCEFDSISTEYIATTDKVLVS